MSSPAPRPSSHGRLHGHLRAVRPASALTGTGTPHSPPSRSGGQDISRPFSARPTARRGAGDGGAAAAVVRLSRTLERRENPNLDLLVECIEHLQELQAREAGDALLWATPPVLRAAREQLLRAIGERQALEAEAANLSAKLEEMVRERKLHQATLDGDAEKARARVARQAQTRAGLEAEAARIRERLAAVEAESASLALKREEAPRLERERGEVQSRALSAHIHSLDLVIREMRCRLDLDADTQAVQEQIDSETARLGLHQGDAHQYTELHKFLMRHEAACADIRAQIDALQIRRERQLRAARRKSKRGTRRTTHFER